MDLLCVVGDGDGKKDIVFISYCEPNSDAECFLHFLMQLLFQLTMTPKPSASRLLSLSPVPSASGTFPLLIFVILGANFLNLVVYNAVWKASIHTATVRNRQIRLMSDRPASLRTINYSAFVGNATAIIMSINNAGNASKVSSKLANLKNRTVLSSSKMSGEAVAYYNHIMAERRELVEKFCAERQKRRIAPAKNFANAIIMTNENLLWCPVFKASSSTWIMYLFEHAKKLPEAKREELRRKYLPNFPFNALKSISSRMGAAKFKGYIKAHNATLRSFLVVRHPFHRLVSAFRDKIERFKNTSIDQTWYYHKYGRSIVSRYRANAIAHLGRDFFSKENNYGAPVKVNGNRTAALPSFWEFVQYVKVSKPQNMDEHWRPTTNYCSLCSIKYDIIVHFENLGNESQYLKHVIDPDRISEESRMNPTPTGLKHEDLTKKYFEQLSHSDIMALYKIYEYDFKMFGYQFSFRTNISLPSY